MCPSDIPIWLTAIGTCGAVIVSLWLAGRQERRHDRIERRKQAELVTAWLGKEESFPDGLFQNIVIQNSSEQCVYRLVASLVSIQGAFRQSAVGSDGRFQRAVGQIPPGAYPTKVKSAGHGMNLRLGIEIAFADAAGVNWLRRGDGRLEEVTKDPVALYELRLPIGWEVG